MDPLDKFFDPLTETTFQELGFKLPDRDSVLLILEDFKDPEQADKALKEALAPLGSHEITSLQLPRGENTTAVDLYTLATITSTAKRNQGFSDTVVALERRGIGKQNLFARKGWRRRLQTKKGVWIHIALLDRMNRHQDS